MSTGTTCSSLAHTGSPHLSRFSLLASPAGKPRGYAFIEYEHKNDMKQAYKMADGRKVEDRRVLVDVERGRTVPNW
jgi:U1 small nuclear ribonucleoprotein